MTKEIKNVWWLKIRILGKYSEIGLRNSENTKGFKFQHIVFDFLLNFWIINKHYLMVILIIIQELTLDGLKGSYPNLKQ